MISSFIMLFEVGLIALLLLLVFRMLTLARNDPFVPASVVTMVAAHQHSAQPPLPEVQQKRSVAAPQPTRTPPSNTCGLITQLHILMSLQDRDCREHGLNLESAAHAVREYAVAWLYGAACALCEKPQRHSDALLTLVSKLASRKIGLRQPEAVQALSTMTGSSTLLACFRSGVSGAEHWSGHRYVPEEHSLYSAVTSNAFI
jgi:hypothetical protein